jgi:Reverse transcriptase (RNA-dependent DNA polymerase)
VRNKDQVSIILVYVNDMALFGSSKNIEEAKKFIGSRYQYTDMGEIEHFLGLHIIRNHPKRTISVDQTRYIQHILEHFDMQTYLPTYTPLPTDTILTDNPEKESDTSFTTHYQQIVGSLMYAMLGTRPDICFAVNRLSQYGSNPTHDHMLAAQHVLKYLATTRHRKLMYGANDSTELIGYSDSDWAGDRDDRRSTTGYTFILSGGSIAWAAQKQRTVALSSTEAEYMALTECLKHTQWTISLLRQLLFEVDLPIDVFTNSTGAESITLNNVYHKNKAH